MQNALTVQLTANTFAASTAAANGLVNQVVTFSTGTFAGSYLVVNDGTAGFQAANDFLVNVTGINGGAAAWLGDNSLVGS